MNWFLYYSDLRHEIVNVSNKETRTVFSLLSANFTKWPNTLKQLVGKLPTIV